MSNIIKNFYQFRNSTGIGVNEGIGDFVSGLLSKGTGAFSDVIKGKIAAYLYEYLGVPEGSFLGTVIEKMVQQVDFSEYGDLLTGGSIPVNKLSEKLADATIEVVTVMGVRPLAEKLGVKDTNGLIYRTIEEMITNESKKEEFHDTLTMFWSWVLGGGSPSSPNKTALFKPELKGKEAKSSIFDFTSSEEKKLASDPAIKSISQQTGGMKVSDILSSLTGGSPTSGGKGLIGGQ
jgi:hypothetical protein